MNISLPPVNREELRIGGAVMFLGGAGAFIANLLHRAEASVPAKQRVESR